MNWVRTAVTTCTVLLLVGGMGWAQGTGSLTIKVIDGDGQPLPGATVTIEHEAGNVKPFTQISNARGQVDFPVLRPGPGYIVTVAMPSFGARREEGIRVPIGQLAVVPIQLSEEVVERVRVVATADVVDLEDTSSTSKFSESFVNDLPVPSRFYQNVLTLAPGVNDPNGDGNPSVHGSRSRDFKATVSGVSNVDPLTGQFMSLVNADSIEEMEVVTSGAGVEFGRAQGGFARIIQKQGTNQFEGTFSFLYRTSKLDGTGAADNSNLPDAEFDELHPSILVSGPVVKDKLWYRLAHEQLDQETPVNTVGAIVTQDRLQGVHSDALTWQMSPRNKIMFQWQRDPLEISNLGVASTNPAESTLSLDTQSETYSVTWTAPYSPRLLVESTLAYQDLVTQLSPTARGVGNSCVPGNVEFGNTLCTNFVTGQTSGGHFLDQQANSQRMTLNSQATLFGGQIWGASHQFKLGFAVENERFFREQNRRPNLGFFVLNPAQDPNGDAGTTPEEIKIVTVTLAVPSESRVRSTGTNWGFYFEDQIKPSPNLVITAGVRVDREELNAGGVASFDPAAQQAQFLQNLADPSLIDPWRPSRSGAPVIDPFTRFFYEDFLSEIAQIINIPGGSNQLLGNLANIQRQAAFWNNVRGVEDFKVSNTNVSPALSVSWDPWSTGKNKFAASARRFYDKIILAIPLIENNPPVTTLVFDAADNPLTGAVDIVGLRNNINPTAAIEVVDRNLKTPYQDEWRVMYERELFTETLMRVEYINRKFRNQLQNRDINHLAGDFGRCRLADTSDTRGLLPSPGSGFEITDPYTGEVYVDIDPGNGDGRQDDCVGKIEVQRNANAQDIRVETPDGFADLYTLNPAFGTVQLVGNFNEANYEAFVFEMIRRQFRSWELQGSYTWSMAVGNGEDFSQDFLGLDPTLVDDERGYQSNDQRHIVKMSATTITPWGFRIGGNLSWSSGLPYSRVHSRFAFDPVPPEYDLGEFSPSRQRIQYPSGERNDARNDSQWLFNMKLTKELQLGHGMNMQLSAEIFNLLNDGTYEVFNPAADAGFQVNGIDQARLEFGRSWQLGMRLSF